MTWTDANTLTAWPPATKPVGEDIAIGMIGQSNALGLHALSGMVQNDNVSVWMPTSGPQVEPFLFRVFNPNFNYGFDGNLATGLPGNGAGNILWGCGDRIQKRLGGRVRLLATTLSGAEVTKFKDGGEVEQEFSVQFPAALAAIPSGPAVLDALIYMQGESNNGDDEATFQADLSAVRQNLITKGIIASDTPFLVCDIGDNYYGTGTRWDGLTGFVRSQPDNVQLVSALGCPETLDVIVYHYLGEGLDMLAERCANLLLSGMKQRFVENNDLEKA